MAAKFDKEALLKHYFWIVSGVALLLILILVVLEGLNAPGVKEKSDFESGLKSVKGLTSGFKNEKFIPAWEERFKEYEGDKNQVWGQAWAPQSTIYDWPDAIRQKETLRDANGNFALPMYPNYFLYPIRDKVKGQYLFPLVLYPNMDLSDDDRRNYKDEWYDDQFEKAWAYTNSPWKNLKIDQGTMMSSIPADREGDVMQAGLPFKLAIAGASASPAGGPGGGETIGGGGPKAGGSGMSLPSAGGPSMPGMSGPSMPGMGGAGGPNASPADAKGAFIAAMRKFSAWQKTPSKEEIWLLQEEYWTRRELITLVRESVASIATFHPVAGDLPVPMGASGRYKAANAFWELDLIIENGGRTISKNSKIRNVHIQQRPQPIADPRTGIQTEFVIYQNRFAKNTKFKLDGEVLPFGKDQSFGKDFPNTGAIDFTKPFDLIQLFTPGTSPVRVLEGLEMPFNSHRTMTSKLVARSTLKKEGGKAEGAAGAEGGAAPAAGGDTGSGAGMGMAMPGMGMGGPGGAPGAPGGNRAAQQDLTPFNKLVRNRYIISNKQCRHVPFAMKLTLDQSTLPTLITALANSKLRIQVTQVQYQYIPFQSSSNVGLGSPAGGKPGMSGGGSPGPGGFGSGGFPGGASPAPGGFPGAPSPGGPAPGGGGDAEGSGSGGIGSPAAGGMGSSALADGNLIDVAIYGIAVLYERFPPPKENPTDLANAAPAADAAPAPKPAIPAGDNDK